MDEPDTYTAFAGARQVASGLLPEVLAAAKAHLEQHPDAEPLLIFHDPTGMQVDFDLRGSLEEVLERAAPAPGRNGPGRPRLGVTSREVSLLPRHWLWLEAQPGGVSAALRRLVEEARKRESPEQRLRRALEAADRFMLTMAGNLPGYEEASRALYARDLGRLEELVQGWPPDVRAYVLTRAHEALRPE